jgi:hypothetical protein
VIHDRDPVFTLAFRETLAAAGVQVIRLPPRSPNLNAYAERFVRTIKESCLDRLILVGESSLRRAIHEFTEHYHHERNHQGMSNLLLFPPTTIARGGRPIDRLSPAAGRAVEVLSSAGRIEARARTRILGGPPSSNVDAIAYSKSRFIVGIPRRALSVRDPDGFGPTRLTGSYCGSWVLTAEQVFGHYGVRRETSIPPSTREVTFSRRYKAPSRGGVGDPGGGDAQPWAHGGSGDHGRAIVTQATIAGGLAAES